ADARPRYVPKNKRNAFRHGGLVEDGLAAADVRPVIGGDPDPLSQREQASAVLFLHLSRAQHRPAFRQVKSK
ncbi:hypothetical protein THAOC_03863, partial [Thalassiosira oceanica]